MSTIQRYGRWVVLLTAMAICGGLAVAAQTNGQPPGKEKEPAAKNKETGKDKDKEPKAQPKPAQKLIAFEMRAKPWVGKGGVLEWLAEQAEMPVVSPYTPTGTFNYIAPEGKPRMHTLGEIIDILNEALSLQKEQKYIIIRR